MLKKYDYLHPLEEKYFDKMMKNVAFDQEIINHYKNFTEKIQKPDLMGKTIRVTEKQFPQVSSIRDEILKYLDIEKPEIFIYEDFYYGVESKGTDDYWIEISAKTIKDFSEKELKFLLAREMADIFLEHTNYYTMMDQLIEGIEKFNILGGDTASKTAKIIMYRWSRVSHYSSDNFGYLMVEDINIPVNSIIKLVLNNKTLAKNINISEYIKQGEEIHLLDDKVSVQTKLDEKVPYGPFRIKNLINYASTIKGKNTLKKVNKNYTNDCNTKSI